MLRVVPLRDPPDGMGTLPLCAFLYFVRRGASCAAFRTCPSRGVVILVMGDMEGRADVDAMDDRTDNREKLESSDDIILDRISYDEARRSREGRIDDDI
jgi:hypothetical protein